MSDPVLTLAQMRAAEQALIERGTSADELMQRAGAGAAEWVWRIARGGAATVLCGPGNNGGDGYVIAETLRKRGLQVAVIAPVAPKTDAARNARLAWRGATATDGEGARGAVLVDCLFGSGLSRPLGAAHAALLGRLAEQHDATVAVDLPSGVETDGGATLGAVPQCTLTIALGAWKPAHFLMPARARMGRLARVDIGIGTTPNTAALFARPRLAEPAPDAHKYRRGLLSVIGGDMPGASVLACEAAMRAGAGYVKLLSSQSHPAAPADLVIDQSSLGDALEDRRIDAALIGPGLGRSDVAKERLRALLRRDIVTLLDADALVLLEPVMLEGRSAPVLATPHEGELARLCDSFGIEEKTKPARAASLASASGITVLAKGPDNVLAAPDGRVAYFAPASSWLSTAGTGDVLAGIAASRLAGGRNAWEAAGEAVWLHGEAARICGAALTAGDLARAISRAYAGFL